MRLGLVSNCWQVQLEEGQSLTSLIEGAVGRGYEVVELRQRSLGKLEDDGGRAVIPSFRELGAEFPQIEFNVAAAMPFLSGTLSSKNEDWRAWRDAACAVADAAVPHLRLVDLETRADVTFDVDAIADQIVALTESLVEVGGLLSLEHSLQPWKPFYDSFRAARESLGENGGRLKVCFDPCNVFLPGDGVAPVEATRQLTPDEPSMLHFKQWTDGQISSRVATGRIDWSELLAVVNEREWQCPGLLEIRSSTDIWAEAAASLEYLVQCGLSPRFPLPNP